jgi:integrase
VLRGAKILALTRSDALAIALAHAPSIIIHEPSAMGNVENVSLHGLTSQARNGEISMRKPRPFDPSRRSLLLGAGATLVLSAAMLPWRALGQAAGLEGLRIHDLRHSFASFGAGASLGLPIIGKLLGHAHPATTHRYAHLDADPMRRAVEVIGSNLAQQWTDANRRSFFR